MNAEKSALIELKFMHATLFTVQIIIKQQKREQIKLVTELSLVKLTSHTPLVLECWVFTSTRKDRSLVDRNPL